MRRWRLRLLVLGAGAALSAASVPTLSAWTSTTSNPSGTVSAIPDWVAPPIERFAVVKEEGGMPGYVKPGGKYHVCSKIGADSGNPASGLAQVLTNVSTLTTGILNGVLNLLGGGSPCLATDNRDSGLLTLSAGTTIGTKSVSIQVRDNANNTNSQTSSVVVDGDLPAPVDVTTVNGGTLNKPDEGDQIIFTFDEAIDPHAIIDGWDGTGQRTITVSGSSAGGGNDRLAFSVPIVASGGYLTIRNDYITGAVTYASSTIQALGTQKGTQYVVTLGAMSDTTRTRARTGTAAMTWATSGLVYDYAGNRLPATAFLEPGSLDADW